jgi:hypothetical protein
MVASIDCTTMYHKERYTPDINRSRIKVFQQLLERRPITEEDFHTLRNLCYDGISFQIL